MSNSFKLFGATILLILVNLGIGGYYLFKKAPVANEEITTPILAIKALTAQTLYFTPPARQALIASAPQRITEEDKNEDSERSRSFVQAAQNPTLWRKLDRQYRFDEILLSGDPTTYSSLLQHLLETGDWTLTYLDQTSLIFRRPPVTSWTLADLEPLKKKFASVSTSDRVTFLVQLAGRLSAITQFNQAKRLLDEALKLNPKAPDALTQLALYYAHFGQWPQALAKTEAALAVDHAFQPALIIRCQALQAMNRFDEALTVTDQLMEISPNDMGTLWLHAIASHRAHDYTREIAALKVLIDLAGQQKYPTSYYRIYLGQAHAAVGSALPALEQFQKALAAGDLSPDEIKFANESIERIKSRQ